MTEHDDEMTATPRRTGDELVELLQDSPLRDVAFEHESVRAPVRDVEL